MPEQPNDVIPAGQLTLPELASVANREHAAVVAAVGSAVEHAILAGNALITAKAGLDHGEWLPWLAVNFAASADTAGIYMMLARNPETSRNFPEPSIAKALGAIRRQRDTARRREHLAANTAGLHEGLGASAFDTQGENWRLLLGDLRDRADDLPDGSVAAIVTDPPYPAEYLPLWDDLGRVAARVLAPGGIIAARCPHLSLPTILALLGEHLAYGWVYAEPLPGSNVRFQGRKIAVAYQPWVAFSNGPWPSGRIDWHPDVLAESPRTKTRYVWEQKASVAAEITATIAPAGSVVLDPFAGSGTYGEAALAVGCRWVGIELDPHGHDQATQRLDAIA